MIVMTDKTENKILDAALKVFAKKGYDAAATRVIAEESGYTEMTLFRKFGTKKNLFDQVMIRGLKKIREDFHKEIFIDQKFENSHDFLETYLRNLVKFSLDTFEFFHLTVTEVNTICESFRGEVIDEVVEYIKKNVPNKRIDYRTYGICIIAFLYALNLDKYHGRTASFNDEEKTIENFIDILYCMINH